VRMAQAGCRVGLVLLAVMIAGEIAGAGTPPPHSLTPAAHHTGATTAAPAKVTYVPHTHMATKVGINLPAQKSAALKEAPETKPPAQSLKLMQQLEIKHTAKLHRSKERDLAWAKSQAAIRSERDSERASVARAKLEETSPHKSEVAVVPKPVSPALSASRMNTRKQKLQERKNVKGQTVPWHSAKIRDTATDSALRLTEEVQGGGKSTLADQCASAATSKEDCEDVKVDGKSCSFTAAVDTPGAATSATCTALDSGASEAVTQPLQRVSPQQSPQQLHMANLNNASASRDSPPARTNATNATRPASSDAVGPNLIVGIVLLVLVGICCCGWVFCNCC